MRKNLLSVLFCLAVSFVNSNAQTTLIHYWNFNSLATTDSINSPGCATTVANNVINPIDADFSTISTSTATVLYRKQPGVSGSWPTTANEGTCFTYYDSYATTGADLDTMNLRMSDTAGIALRTRNPSDSMELLIYMPSTSFTNLLLQYGCERSGSGMLTHDYDYSVDSGVTFITTGLTATTNSVNTTFSLFSVNLSACTGLNNNPKAVFRIRFTGNNNTLNGNDRFDNITVDGTGSAALGVNQNTTIAPVYSIYPNPSKSGNIEITSDQDGEKTVTITNMLGQVVLSETASSRNFAVNTGNLQTGVYYISIRENETGSLSTMKFMKQ